MDVVILLLFFLFSFYAIHLFIKNKKARNRFESSGIPYLGNGHLRMFTNILKGISLIEDVQYMYKFAKNRGAKLCGSTDFGTTTLIIQDPEVLKAIFVKDFDHFEDRRAFEPSKKDVMLSKMLICAQGEKWRALRTTLSPTFTTGKIKRLFPIFEESGRKLIAYFRNQAESSLNNEVEVEEGCSKYTMDIIASAACGMNSQAFNQKEPSLFERKGHKLQVKFEGLQLLKLLVLFTSKGLADILGLRFFSKEVQDFFTNSIKSNIKQRLDRKERRNDFIQLMLEARKGNLKAVETELKKSQDNAQLKINSHEVLDDDGIVANAVLFILAGFDTTHSLLVFLPYVLALNQIVQDKLREEVDSILAENDGKLSYDAIGRMTYLDMVISETLRMYPPIVATERRCTKNYTIPGTDFTLKKGELVVIPTLGIHHDPKYYPEPEKFSPHRFSPENKKTINPYTYLPFGQGPRNCIGMRFALAETKVAIALLVHNFRIEPSKNTPIPMKLSTASFLKPKDKMRLVFHKIR